MQTSHFPSAIPLQSLRVLLVPFVHKHVPPQRFHKIVVPAAQRLIIRQRDGLFSPPPLETCRKTFAKSPSRNPLRVVIELKLTTRATQTSRAPFETSALIPISRKSSPRR